MLKGFKFSTIGLIRPEDLMVTTVDNIVLYKKIKYNKWE